MHINYYTIWDLFLAFIYVYFLICLFFNLEGGNRDALQLLPSEIFWDLFLAVIYVYLLICLFFNLEGGNRDALQL